MSFRAGTNIPVPELVSRDHGVAAGILSRDSLTLLGGVAPYKFTAPEGLPEGLVLDTTGVLSGTLTTTGDYLIPIDVASKYTTGRDTIRLHVAQTQSYGTKPFDLSRTRMGILLSNYDKGGEGIAFHDADVKNTGDANFRTTEGVDIVAVGALKALGNIQTGEWLHYSLDVPMATTYKFTLDYATPDSTNVLRFAVDGIMADTAFLLPATGTAGTALADFKKDTLELDLPLGLHVLRLHVANASQLRLYRIEFTRPEGLGVQELNADAGLTLYNHGETFTLTAAEPIRSIRILDAGGRIWYTGASSGPEVELGSTLPKGLYLLQVETAAGTQVLKWIK
jgi:hypothetical protein